MCLEIIDFIKNTKALFIERAALYQIFNVFKKIEDLNYKFAYFKSILYPFWVKILKNVDFN